MKPRTILAGLLITAVFLIILIAAGVFDPKPVGTVQTTLPAMLVRVEQAGQTIKWLGEPLPAADFSVRETAVWQSGSQDSGMGLAIGSKTDNLIVAVSPLGYVLVQQNGVELLPWQPWPHVRLGDVSNEIWIDVQGDMVAIRINRELLWRGSMALSGRNLGLFTEHFGETAVFSSQSIQIYAP